MPAAGAADVGAEQVERERDRPDGDLRLPSRPAATNSSPTPIAARLRAWQPPRAARGRPVRRRRRGRGARSGRRRTRRRRGTRRRRRRPARRATRSASRPSRRTSRAAPTPSSGSIVFVSQAYAAHAHQSTPSTSRPLTRPAHVGSATTRPVTCVIAKTKIRSKKSSSGVTRSSALSCRVPDRHRASLSFGMRVLRAAAWAAALSGSRRPCTRSRPDATHSRRPCAAGSILLPRETSPERLLAAAVPVHLASPSPGRSCSTAPACAARLAVASQGLRSPRSTSGSRRAASRGSAVAARPAAGRPRRFRRDRRPAAAAVIGPRAAVGYMNL